MSIDNVTYFTMTPVELLLYENRMRIGSEVQEILELFQMLYNLHFSKDLSDCIIKNSCASSNKYLGSFTLYQIIKM